LKEPSGEQRIAPWSQSQANENSLSRKHSEQELLTKKVNLPGVQVGIELDGSAAQSATGIKNILTWHSSERPLKRVKVVWQILRIQRIVASAPNVEEVLKRAISSDETNIADINPMLLILNG
jgi:hypothetical protein